MTTTAEPQVLPDAGRGRCCGDMQWDHKRGRGGCKVPGCGCPKYLPPKVVLAEVVERSDDADPGVCVAGFEPAQPGDVDLPVALADHPTLAEVEAEPEPVDEPEPAPAPVVADPAAQAESQRLVAIIDAELGPLAEAMAADVPAEPDETAAEIERLTAERDEAVRQRGYAKAALDRANEARRTLRHALDGALADVRSLEAGNLAYANENARLRDDVNRADAARRKAQDALDEAYRTGLAAALRVLWQYDADQCLTDGCGFRTTVPGLHHQHPMRPVTVLVVDRDTTARADAPADEHTTKEN